MTRKKQNESRGADRKTKILKWKDKTRIKERKGQEKWEKKRKVQNRRREIAGGNVQWVGKNRLWSIKRLHTQSHLNLIEQKSHQMYDTMCGYYDRQAQAIRTMARCSVIAPITSLVYYSDQRKTINTYQEINYKLINTQAIQLYLLEN